MRVSVGWYVCSRCEPWLRDNWRELQPAQSSDALAMAALLVRWCRTMTVQLLAFLSEALPPNPSHRHRALWSRGKVAVSLSNDGLVWDLAIGEVLVQPPGFDVIPAVEVLDVGLDVKQRRSIKHIHLGEVHPVPFYPPKLHD